MKKILAIIVAILAVVGTCVFNWSAVLGSDVPMLEASTIWSLILALQYAGAVGAIYLTNLITKGYIKEITLRWLQR